MSEVIARLVGGLGNQMFQYAAARSLALQCNVPLMLDTSWFESVSDRKFALSPFRIKAEVISEAPSQMFWRKPSLRVVHQLVKRLGVGEYGKPLYAEKSFHYDPGVMEQRAPVCLEGYFQSEKYFSAYGNIISDDLQLVSYPRPATEAMLNRIRACDAVCVHIRRGDYVLNPATHAFHGVCPMDYYHRGLEYIAERLKQPHCFVFSDDPLWVRDNFRPDLPMTLVDLHGADEAHEDLRLMFACHSFVIANSSLSWWGAWLGRREGKCVVAPQRWFATPDKDTRDLIPADWVRL